MSLQRLHAQDERFVDETGRQVLLRGVNLGGDSKVPWPNGGTQHPSDFADHRSVSFIGRPFPLDEADSHLERIKAWGFNCLRLLTTWEAVEHAGPGAFDLDYLEYFAAVCRKAGEHGLYVFIDFHQDVWSRMSGGDGAPGWTFEAVGLDFTRFASAQAAHIMQASYDYSAANDSANAHQTSYPAMSWPRNYRMPANAIMWTLFWAGEQVTPRFVIDGRNVQEYLQSHLLGAMEQVAVRVRHMPHVIGFDSMNEPGTGWLGQSLSPVQLDGERQLSSVPLPGPVWSPLEALAVARGVPTELAVRGPIGSDKLGSGETGQRRETLNPKGISIWRDGALCPFEQAGIYALRDGHAVALQEGAFCQRDGRAFSLAEDAYAPFFKRVASTLRTHQSAWLLFAEIDPFGAFAGRGFPRELPPQTVNASHWYDLSVLVNKSFDPALSIDLLSGQKASSRADIYARFVQQLAAVKAQALGASRQMPTLIGEFGIPYDLDNAAAYAAWARGERDPSIWRSHVLALELMYDALDELHLSATQWNYTASNHNHGRIGDQWNQEDLSIYSVDQPGGRAVAGFCRPYARAVQGRLCSMRFAREAGLFELTYLAEPGIKAATVVYLPSLQFPHGVDISVSGAIVRQKLDPVGQTLHLWADAPGLITLHCSRRALVK